MHGIYHTNDEGMEIEKSLILIHLKKENEYIHTHTDRSIFGKSVFFRF